MNKDILKLYRREKESLLALTICYKFEIRTPINIHSNRLEDLSETNSLKISQLVRVF